MTLKDYFDCLFDDFDFVDLRLLPEKNVPAAGGARSKILSKNELLKKIESGDIEKIMRTTTLYPCVGVNPRLAGNRRELLAVKNMLIDYDDCEPPKVALENANIVCRRENNWHLYFCFDPLPNTKEIRALYTQYAKNLAQLTGADINATDPSRVVRVPGFVYRKNGANEPGYKIEKIDTTRRSFDDTLGFVVLLKNKALTGSELGVTKSFREMTSGVMSAGLDENETDFVAQSKIEAQKPDAEKRIENFILQFYSKKEAVPQGRGRSKFLYVFGCDCHGWGIELERALELAKIVNREKCLPPEDEKTVQNQIKSAYKYRKAAFGSYLDAFGSARDENEITKAIKQIELVHKITENFADWVYCHEAERFLNTKNGLTFTSQNQSELYMTQKIGERVTLRFALMHGALRTVHKLDYRPDCEKFYDENGLDYYNTHRAPKNLPRECDKDFAIETFKKHLAYLTNNEKEFAWLAAWIAFTIQNPGKKVMWAPLIISQQTGVGKSALIELLKIIFGEWNVSEVSSYDLLAQHTDYMAEKILVASHEVELAEKEAMHRLKNLITEKKVRIVQKYARTYEATNCANFIFLSNKPDALKIDEEDRRLFVVYHRKPPQPQEYYTKLFEAINKGAGHIYDHLCSVSLYGFDPYRRPPVTEGKELVIANSEGDLSHYLAALRDEQKSVFAQDYFQTHELLSYVQEFAPMNVKKYCTTRSLQIWLSKNGYQSHVVQQKISGVWRKKCFWTDKMTKQDIEIALKDKIL